MSDGQHRQQPNYRAAVPAQPQPAPKPVGLDYPQGRTGNTQQLLFL